MSQLKTPEKAIFEDLFNRGGYVLNFTDKTYAEFFREHNIDIDNNKYRFNGDSKMKRLRAFWEVEPNEVVGNVLEALIEYACTIEEVNDKTKAKALAIAHRLQGKNQDNTTISSHE